MRRKIDPAVEAALNASGLNWKIEKRSKHNVVVVNGQIIMVLSRSFTGDWRQRHHSLAQLRQHLRKAS